MRVEFSLRIKHTGFHGIRFAGLAQIVCDLSVKEPEAVRAGHAKLCARREIEKAALSRLRLLRHSCPDQNRLSNCLSNPRRTGGVAGAAALTAPLRMSKDFCEPAMLASCGARFCVWFRRVRNWFIGIGARLFMPLLRLWLFVRCRRGLIQIFAQNGRVIVLAVTPLRLLDQLIARGSGDSQI